MSRVPRIIIQHTVSSNRMKLFDCDNIKLMELFYIGGLVMILATIILLNLLNWRYSLVCV